MVRKTLFQCPECSLHYKDQTLAQRCEAFCSKYHACSLEIIRHSIEHQEFLSRQSKESDNEG